MNPGLRRAGRRLLGSLRGGEPGAFFQCGQFPWAYFGQYTAKPSVFKPIRYSDRPAVTYSILRSWPPNTQLVGVSGAGMKPIFLPAGVKITTPAVLPCPAVP